MFKFDDIICDIKFEKVNKINDVNNINRVCKLKSFSLMINFDKNSRVDYLKINIELTRKNDIYLLL